MSETARITGELSREHSGDPWHGPSLAAILRGISAADASRYPVAGAHSIWELVLHVTAWKNEVRRRLAGAPAAVPLEGDWPPVGDPTSERWTHALERLDAAHNEQLETIDALPDERLDEPTNDPRSPGGGVPYYVLLHGAVQHDVYHAGQMALLKKAAAAG